MANAPERSCSKVADKAGYKSGNKRFMADQPDGKHLQSEHSTGQRRSKNRAESPADPAYKQNSAVNGLYSEQPSKPLRQATAHLYGRPLTACRSAEQMGNQSSE
ncbi:hypothetical protein D3C80_1850400 [compost metagenome]